ncbi:MAG: MFS transporter, partial [Pseudonocardiaceae bacterium]
MPDEMLLSWGWRVPFWASFVLVIGAYLVRRHLDEPEVFVEETDEAGTPETSPLATLLRTHRAALIRVVIISLYATIHQIPPIFAVAFATSPAIGISRSTMLWVSVACFTVQLIVFPFAGLA